MRTLAAVEALVEVLLRWEKMPCFSWTTGAGATGSSFLERRPIVRCLWFGVWGGGVGGESVEWTEMGWVGCRGITWFVGDGGGSCFCGKRVMLARPEGKLGSLSIQTFDYWLSWPKGVALQSYVGWHRDLFLGRLGEEHGYYFAG